jgi:hypothetical protein
LCLREHNLWRIGDRKLTTSSVEQSVAKLDGIVHGVGASSIVHLPQPEANLWHLVAGIELEGRRSHFLCSCVESRSSKIEGRKPRLLSSDRDES